MAIAASGPEPSARAPALRPVPRPAASRPLVPDLVRAELTKLRTVRSTWWALALTVAAMVVLGALFAARYGIGGISPADKARFDPAAYSLSGFFLAQLAVGVLGVLTITSEYATGSIRATFAATPQRRAVLAAEATVLTAITALVGIGSSLATFFVVTPYLPSDAGQALIGRTKFAPSGPHLLSPWVGVAVVCAYAAAALIAAAVILSRQDA